MSFFFKVLTGAVIGGSATLYYRTQIQSTTSQLSSDLDKLSQKLVTSRQVSHQPIYAPDGTPYIPRRIPLTEEIKARWNDQLSNGIESVRQTDWNQVGRKSWETVKGLTGKAKEEIEGSEFEREVKRAVGEGPSSGVEGATARGIVDPNKRMVDRIDGKL